MLSYTHPQAVRDLTWDLANVARVRKYLHDIKDETDRGLADRALARFEQDVLPGLADLPRQVVHGDANDYNVLIAEEALVDSLAGDGDAAGIGVLGEHLQLQSLWAVPTAAVS